MADSAPAQPSADAPKASAPPKKKPTRSAKPSAKDGTGGASLSPAAAAKRKLPPSLRKRSRRYRALLDKHPFNPKEARPLAEAVKLARQLAAGGKTDQTINICLHLGIDPRQADQLIRGSVSLPKGIGKTKKVIAFVADDASAEAARKAGAIAAGSDELVKKIEEGWLDFDVAIATPQLMGKVGKLGKVLGPQGKMPTPKNGTVTADVVTAVTEFTAGKLEFRNDDGGNIHAVIGKASFSADDLATNAHAFIEHIRRARPPTQKGAFIRKISVAGSNSPGVLVVPGGTEAASE
mgnify:CR=1 FL=1